MNKEPRYKEVVVDFVDRVHGTGFPEIRPWKPLIAIPVDIVDVVPGTDGYILTSSKQTLARKDREAEDGKILSKGSSLFSKEQVVRKDGHLARYEDIIRQNKLLFTLDLIKEKLCEAYKMTDEPSMAGAITEIMDMCMATGNKHLLWFRRLLDNHFEGIIAHATYDISAGKIEGVNGRIKTLRRQGYGYPDDDYFFLKLFDASRKGYVRNPVAERIPQNL